MTLAELSDAWNELRNETLGRGTTPLVSPGLARRIGAEWEAWRRWYESANPLDDALGSVGAQQWVERYRALAEYARREGRPVTRGLSPTPVERAKGVAQGAAVGVGGALTLALLAAVVTYVAMRNPRPGGARAA